MSIHYFSSGSVCSCRLSFNVFYCTVTINHSDFVTYTHTHTHLQMHIQNLIYLFGHCIIQIEISFYNREKTLAHLGHWLYCFIETNNYNLITIYSPLFVCVCICLCIFQWVRGRLGEAQRLRGCRCSCVWLIVLTSR